MSQVTENYYNYWIPHGSFVIICRMKTQQPFKTRWAESFDGFSLTFLLNGINWWEVWLIATVIYSDCLFWSQTLDLKGWS